ncbi:MAG: glycosyltransferase family 4 protein [Thermoflexales bacterium]|nr:glycosyltransferase family 4 protein [Thermoflexales bacterium]
MNIALIHYSAPPIVGGVESVLGHHARLMSDAGHRVTIIAGRGEASDERVPVRVLPRLDSRHPETIALKDDLDAGQVPAGFDAARDSLQRELERELRDCDVLIAHNVASLNKNLALTAALHRLRRPARILWHHDLAWTTPRYRAELHEGYPWDLLRLPWANTLQVVVSTFRKVELAELMRIDLASIRVVPNGVDVAAFLKLEPRTQSLLKQLPLLDASPLLLLPVRLTPRKNISLALRALASLTRDFPDAQLLVTGPEGPHNAANATYKRRLLELRDALGLRGKAHFLAEITPEFLPDAVIADFYRLADALILPSLEEGFGIPIIEAGFAHMPVFCSDIAVLRELGGDALTYFAPDADPNHVAGLIADGLRASPGYQWACRARRNYAWENIYRERIAPVLEEALAKSHLQNQ